MSKHLKNILIENNIVFEGGLRVHMDVSSLDHVPHKFFSHTANYPKGEGDQFKSYMKKNSEAPLVNVVNKKGSRQDICIYDVPFFYINHSCWVDFFR